MDQSGHWHTRDDIRDRVHEGLEGKPLDRPVITIGLGEMVRVVDEAGRAAMCEFQEVVGENRVQLKLPDSPPYFEFALPVTIENAAGEKCRGQVWDNRNGNLVIRTLPL